MNALELEMYINFGEFETRLYEVDVDAGDNEQDDGIWASVMNRADTNNPKGGNGQHQISVMGHGRSDTYQISDIMGMLGVYFHSTGRCG